MPVLLDGKKIKSTKALDAALIEKAQTWTDLNFHLPEMNLEEVTRLIYLETTSRARWPVIRRALGRRNRLGLEADLNELKTAIEDRLS